MDKNHILDTDRINEIAISDVVALFDQPIKKGRHWVALCPWHNDHHPSLVLNEGTNQNYCKCFSCGHGGGVIKYTQQKLGLRDDARGFRETCLWLCTQFDIPLLDGSTSSTSLRAPVTKPTTASEAPLAYVPEEVMLGTVTMNNPFSQCLAILFGTDIADRLTRDYRLGLYIDRYHNEYTIFWSIDEDGHVHNGKVQRYCTDPTLPAFAHSDKACKAYWLTHEPILSRITPEGYRLDCGGLYGIHLLKTRPQTDEVIIVESPKNAIMGAAAFPDYIWLAAGNKNALTPAALRILNGRIGKIYPDRDAITEWQQQRDRIKELHGFEVRTFCEDHAPMGNSKFDIADYIVNEILRE